MGDEFLPEWKKIINVLVQFTRAAKLFPGQSLIIYFSGHGVSHKGENYWVPGDLDDKMNNLVSRDDLVRALSGDMEENKIKNNVMIVSDSCSPGWASPPIVDDEFPLSGRDAAPVTVYLSATSPFGSFFGTWMQSGVQAGTPFAQFLELVIGEQYGELKKENKMRNVSASRVHQLVRERLRGVVQLKRLEFDVLQPQFGKFAATEDKSGQQATQSAFFWKFKDKEDPWQR
ncbi:MAG: caspase family protein [Magnetococcus sp. MYC-9]